MNTTASEQLADLKPVIVIPTYNEADSIKTTLEKLFNLFKQENFTAIKVLVFDSNSEDDTKKIVEQLQQQHPNLFLLSEAQKTGLGSAYIKGVNYAINKLNAKVVFEYDADGSHQAKYIFPMLKKIVNGADVVVGSRFIKGGSIPADWHWSRKLLSITGNSIARFFLTRKYRDFTSGFRATKVSFLKQVSLEKLLSKQFAYKIHLFWALHQLNANIIEHPIEFIDRTQGYSKFPRNNILDSLKVVIALRWLTIKQQFFSGFSILKNKT